MKIEIDPEKFVKENLLLYLEAIFTVLEFNKFENQQFKNMKEDEIRNILSKILGARIN